MGMWVVEGLSGSEPKMIGTADLNIRSGQAIAHHPNFTHRRRRESP